MQVLAFFQLKPRTRVFTFPDGSSTLLLSLYGVLQGVPVIVWIPKQYPTSVPYLYLDFDSLASSSKIQVSQFLDSSGKFYLPIFQTWASNPESLLKVISQLLESWRVCYPLIGTSSATSPKLPTESLQVPVKKEPEVLPLPPKLFHNATVTGTSDQVSPSAISLMEGPPPIPKRPAFLTPPRNVSNTSNQFRPPKIEQNNMHNPKGDLSGRVPVTTVPHENSELTQAPQGNEGDKFTFSLPPDLIDDISEVKADATHNELLQKLNESIAKLVVKDKKEFKSYLRSRSFNIDAILTKYSSHIAHEKDVLERLKQSIEENTLLIGQEIEHIEEETEKAQGLETELDPSSIAIPETPAFVQLYNLVAKDHALNDAIGIVSQLFHREKISMNIMIRKTRELSLEQFKTRYLISKITDLLD